MVISWQDAHVSLAADPTYNFGEADDTVSSTYRLSWHLDAHARCLQFLCSSLL